MSVYKGEPQATKARLPGQSIVVCRDCPKCGASVEEAEGSVTPAPGSFNACEYVEIGYEKSGSDVKTFQWADDNCAYFRSALASFKLRAAPDAGPAAAPGSLGAGLLYVPPMPATSAWVSGADWRNG